MTYSATEQVGSLVMKRRRGGVDAATWLGSLAACSRKWDTRNLHKSA